MSSSSSHKLKIDSYDTNTEKATLYAADHTAQVQRRFEVSLKPGKTSIDIENLPNLVEEDTLRVEGYGHAGVAATIVEVVCFPFASKPFRKRLLKSFSFHLPRSSSFERRSPARTRSWNRWSLKFKTILQAYPTALKPSNIPHSELGSYLSFSASKWLEPSASRTKANEDIESLNSEIETLVPGKKDEQKNSGKVAESREWRTAEDLLSRGRQKTIRVLVDVRGDGEEDVKERSVSLILIYVIRGAGWSPIYDIRADTTPSVTPTGEKLRNSNEAAQKDTLSIHYRASITNTTGEPWIQTQIVLSTAAPGLGSTIRTLRPYRLGFPKAVDMTSSMFDPRRASDPRFGPRSPYNMARSRSQQQTYTGGGDSEDEGPRQQAVPFAQMSVQVEEGGAMTSAVLKIEGKSDIECDGGAHRVSIAALKLNVELSHITVPSTSATAFLQASVKNASPYPFLPGPTTIYIDGNLAGRGQMGDVSPEETFKISLGVDGAVRVTFHPEDKFKTTSGFFLSSTKTENVSFVQKVTIDNTRPRPISILVQSSFPISEVQKIVVRLVHPSSTLPAEDADGRGGITRWVEGKKEEGMIEWVGKVGGREKKIWKYGWEVEGNGFVAKRWDSLLEPLIGSDGPHVWFGFFYLVYYELLI